MIRKKQSQAHPILTHETVKNIFSRALEPIANLSSQPSQKTLHNTQTHALLSPEKMFGGIQEKVFSGTNVQTSHAYYATRQIQKRKSQKQQRKIVVTKRKLS